ncbi:MFS transporter [Geobacter sp. SVR]|nr:MFS transporter [Geobacter sp. SVR]
MRIPVFPLHAASLGADTVRVGMLNALFLLMAGSLCVPAGMLSDRVGRRLPIMAGILVLGCSSLGLSFSSSVAHLAAVCVLSGIGTAVFAPPLMSYVADITPPARLGSAFGWYTTCLYGGMTIGPAAGGLLGRTLGFRPVFLISGLLIVALFGVVLFFLPPSRPHGTTAPQPAGAALLSTLCNRRLLVCLGSLLGSCIGYGLFITFMPLYARSLGLDSGHIGLVFAVQALSNALSRIPFGRLGDRLGDRSVLVVTGLVGFSLSLAILAGAKSLGLLLLGAAAFGVTLGVAFTALVALTADAAPREQRGLALGLYNSCLYLGMMLSSALMGLVIRRHGYGTAFYLCGGITLAVALLFFCLYRRPPAAAPEAAAWEASP